MGAVLIIICALIAIQFALVDTSHPAETEVFFFYFPFFYSLEKLLNGSGNPPPPPPPGWNFIYPCFVSKLILPKRMY